MDIINDSQQADRIVEQDLARIFNASESESLSHDGRTTVNLSWYSTWVQQQIKFCSRDLLSVLPGRDMEDSEVLSEDFKRVWFSVAHALINELDASVDSVVQLLFDQKLFLNEGYPSKLLDLARNLVFAIIGWQSMLYKTDPDLLPTNMLRMADEMDGFQGTSRLVLQQPMSLCRRSISDLLIPFGVLLPSASFVTASEKDTPRRLRPRSTVDAQSLNIYALVSLTKIRIEWVDSISCHLELDQQNSVLFLFRFPSFCFVNFENVGKPEGGIRGPIYACATRSAGSKQWGCEEEVKQLLKEVLISYRLLFGQSKDSRKLFKRLKPFRDLSGQVTDELLVDLCGRKVCFNELQKFERDIYGLNDDFPLLKGKLATLENFLSQHKPRTWKQLWQDKRDGGQWFTFWAVLLIGGAGIILAILQVILQILQLIFQSRGP